MKQIWFITGSQDLYGEETLKQVDIHSKEMIEFINSKKEHIICDVVYKGTLKNSTGIKSVLLQAMADENCIGIIAWMHTFSPSKMWIAGLSDFKKPFLHFHTQFNKEIPWNEIDMDFMNLNQSAHGDREHGFIHTRMNLSRKVITGYYKEEATLKRIGKWIRVALGIDTSKNLIVCRFGDNMRDVAVTEGNKVSAEIKFGWSVNTWGVGNLVECIKNITDSEVKSQLDEYKQRYDINTTDLASVEYQAKLNIAIKKVLKSINANAYTNTFEDLFGLEQLPGLATQNLMFDGYGFGAEGDWKTSAMLHIIKSMSKGLKGGSSFMEDYTYHMIDGGYVLGAHMLEVCPSIAESKAKIEVHKLGIGGKNSPARLTFNGRKGTALQVSLIELSNRYRLIVNKCNAFAPLKPMPKLPVASVMWSPYPNLETATESWIYAGGAHHTVMTYDIDVEMLRDFAEYFDIEFVLIDENTDINNFKQNLKINNAIYRII